LCKHKASKTRPKKTIFLSFLINCFYWQVYELLELYMGRAAISAHFLQIRLEGYTRQFLRKTAQYNELRV